MRGHRLGQVPAGVRDRRRQSDQPVVGGEPAGEQGEHGDRVDEGLADLEEDSVPHGRAEVPPRDLLDRRDRRRAGHQARWLAPVFSAYPR